MPVGEGAIRLGLAAAVGVGIVGIGAALTAGPDHPDAWDPRVLDLVAFVEEERGHAFEHPVRIEFLAEQEYAERTRSDEAALTDEAREEVEQQEALFRALGLAGADVDLFESGNDLSDSGTLAFYNFDTETIVVRGQELTPDVRATLVHELTHTLQDQVFGLDGPEGDDVTSGQEFGHLALVEGDAGRIEAVYSEEELTDEERAEAESALDEGLAELEEQQVPGALQALFGAPYAFGDGFVAVLAASGAEGVDEAFERLPTTEEHVFDPFTFLAGNGPVTVDPPDIGGIEPFDDGDFGAASLYIVLSERIDSRQALAASLGWGGDAYVAYEQDGRVCVSIAVTGDTPQDTDELEAALSAWAGVQPDGVAGASRDGDVVLLRSCDPGDAALPASGASLDALSAPAVRSLLAASALESGAPEAAARCFGDGVVAALTDADLNAEALTPEIEARIAEIAGGCAP